MIDIEINNLFKLEKINDQDMKNILDRLYNLNNTSQSDTQCLEKELPYMLSEIFSAINFRITNLDSSFLSNEKIAKKIFSCKEFSGVDSIEFLSTPISMIDGKVCTAESLQLTNQTKFKGKIYIYSVDLSDEIYDYSYMVETPKDAVIFPVSYNRFDFSPRKGVCVFWNPEQLQDEIALGNKIAFNNKGERIKLLSPEEKFRKKLHDILDNALDNQKEHEAHGYRQVRIRGYFPDMKNEINKHSQDNTMPSCPAQIRLQNIIK